MRSDLIATWLDDETRLVSSDLHVDEIAPDRSAAHWLTVGFQALALAARIIDTQRQPKTVALALPLQETAKRDELPPKAAAIAYEDASTPPSLYAFRRGGEPWRSQHASEFVKVSSLRLLGYPVESGYISNRLDPEDDVWVRTLWIPAGPTTVIEPK